MDSIKAKFADVQSFLEKVTDLPVLPDHITKISTLLSDENTGAPQIANAIAQDQGLATKILKIANSVYYGRISQVISLNEAVAVIGFSNIKSMLFALFVDQLSGDGSRESADFLKVIWRHSLAAALISSSIMEEKWPADRESAYIGGLLHDIGELILLKYEPVVYIQLIGEIQSDPEMPRTMTEEGIIGFTHADLGAEITKKWNLPREIKNTVFFHHNPADAEQDKRLIECVRLADILSNVISCGGTDVPQNRESAVKLITEDMRNILKLDEARLNKLFESSNAAAAAVDAIMQSVK
jgi:putative nucleotidyltransferase with HDIG domain